METALYCWVEFQTKSLVESTQTKKYCTFVLTVNVNVFVLSV
jgi:hypothetical protein